MQKRGETLKNHPLLLKNPPKIKENRHISNGDKIQITCKLENGQKVYCYFRAKKNLPFVKVELKDDGYQGDGAAFDGILGISLPKNQCSQYYLMATNADAVSLIPERASYEFIEVK
jgi:hypothetical protein